MIIVGVKFKEGGKVYNFSAETEYEKGTKVIVETERGTQLGVVETITNDQNKSNKNLKEIKSVATDSDYDRFLKNVKDAKKALVETKEKIRQMNLNMNLIDASYTFDRKVLLFNFVSDERVDFRELVRALAAKYHTRIELHQVGVRDKAKEIGGVGLCGRPLCCTNHLQNVNTVNINMVKNQNIALNPTKINGACGRLLCCFTYENDLYEQNRKELPKVGEKVSYKSHEVTVVDVEVLTKTYTVKINENTFEKVNVD